MTSVLPPDLRPPSAVAAHSLVPHAKPSKITSRRNQGGDKTSSMVEDDDAQFIDSRPVKKRKTSHSLASGSLVSPTTANQTSYDANQKSAARYRGVPWLSLTKTESGPDITRTHTTAIQPSPLPARPWSTSRTYANPLESGRPGSRVRRNVAVPTTPDSMLDPEDAPTLEEETQADYFPWMGKHQEDILNESTVKQGFIDKASNPPERELSTGKPALYSAFNHRSGIDSLSALFSLLLEQKENQNSLSKASNFKGPPPRVTLTEAKRKSWIADLANLEMPLRRLSKTIPQGIRGQMLLDQCLLNSVPLSRAVWFAKCVGANEIRTLKRKGVTMVVAQGAEAKWLKEWTASVEQFVEQNLGQCGQDGCKQRIHYVIQLVSRLYASNLLDRDHFLDWIVKSVVAASTNVLPFWLMISSMFRPDLLQFRKRARQFTEALVIKYRTISRQPGEVLKSLVQKLKEAVRSCLSMRPMSFLMPEKWTDYEEILTACISTESQESTEVLENVKRSNERILYGNSHEDLLDRSVTECALEVLDLAHSPFLLEKLSQNLLELSPDHREVVKAVCEWAVTKFRTGQSRIYLAARLLRRWLRQNSELDSTLLGFVFQELRPEQIDLSALRHLVSELSRAHIFSVSTVLQYLSVRGLPKKGSFSSDHVTAIFKDAQAGPRVQCPQEPSQLLTELCLNNVDAPLQNWRSAMLSRAGYDVDNENEATTVCKSWTEHFVLDATESANRDRHILRFAHLPWTIRTHLSHWIRVTAMESARTPSGVALVVFCRMRYVLESLGDLSILADVLRAIVQSKDENLLATCVDTINYHAEAFSAVGALDTLQQLYCRAYLTLRPVKLSMPLLTSSLIDLCHQYPNPTTPVKALQQEFVRGDRGRAIAACSPFSDGVAESLEQAGETFYDDFEAILQTESNMNEQTMNQLFEVLTNRIVKLNASDEHNYLNRALLYQLLSRLKTCRKSHGDTLMQQWLTKLDLAMVKNNPRLLLDLVGSRCVDLDVILGGFRSATFDAGIKDKFIRLLSLVLELPQHPAFSPELLYSIKLATKQVVLSDTTLALQTIGLRTEESTITPFYNQALFSAILRDNDSAAHQSGIVSEPVQQIVNGLLGNTHNDQDSARQVLALIQTVTAFALPFCQTRMRGICQAPAFRNDLAFQREVTDVLCDWLEKEDSVAEQTATSIQSLLKCVSPGVEAKVKARIEQTFFQHLPKTFSNKSVTQPALPTADEMKMAISSFRRVLLINSSKTGASQPGNGSLLIEKLTIYLKCLGSASAAVGSANAASSPVATTPIIGSGTATAPPEWTPKFIFTTLELLNLLLRMICLKRMTVGNGMAQPSPVAAKQHQQDQIKLLGLLISIATHPSWECATHWPESTRSQREELGTTTDAMFDVAATLVDDMADESRMFCARLLKDRLRNERVKWLLGSVTTNGSAQCEDAGHGLQMYHEGKGVVTGEFKPKVWEMLEYNGTTGDASLSLGLFGVKKV